MARIVLPAALQQFTAGAKVIEIEQPDGAGLRALLDALGTTSPALVRRICDEQGELRRFVNVYIDGEDVRRSGGLDAPVPAGAEVLILPSVAGG
jgi:molybdopterin synthase sulfur carrier subunit